MIDLFSQPDGVEFGDEQEMKQWSADRKSYVSAKIIPGYGTLIYMACTSNPELGWDDKGFAQFNDISDVPNMMSMADEGREKPQETPPRAGKSVKIDDQTRSPSNLAVPSTASTAPSSS